MKDLFKNCISVHENDGWFAPIRFTQKQLTVYENIGEAEVIRSRCAASVMLAFKSDAKKLTLGYRIKSKSRNWASFDVVCDGLLYCSIPPVRK